jgi:UTP--glucose-1-phosphate uridylyltransferase
VIAAEKPCLQQMVEAYAETGGCMVAAMEVRRPRPRPTASWTSAEDMGRSSRSRAWSKSRKAPGTAPSNLAVIGRYILTPKVLTTSTG